jgi:hypothetical protein
MNLLHVIFEQHHLVRFIHRLEFFFKKWPHAPIQLMEFLVSLMPAVFVSMGIMSGLIGALSLFASAHNIQTDHPELLVVSPLYLMVTGMLSMANGMFMLMAFPDVRDKSENGWESLFLVNLVTILQSLLSFFFYPSTIIGSTIFAVLTLYLTFEFRPYFHRK